MIKCRKLICVLLTGLICVLLAGPGACAEEGSALARYLEAAARGGPVYEVIQDGTGDFTGIQEAVGQVESGATLLIHPGVYEENVEIIGKTVNLIGAGRECCILISDAVNYHRVPLTIGAGIVYNMTICGSNPDKENIVSSLEADYDSSDPASVYEWQDRFPGYAVHIDQDYSRGRELLIERCRIISDSNQCVGIGSRGQSTITFADCQFFSNGGGCLFLHNTQGASGTGDTYFTMRDCELRNYWSPYIMSVYSMGDLNPIYLTFQNVRVSTVAYETKDSYDSGNMNTWYNVDQLDSPKVKSFLEETGYYSSIGEELIHRCSSEESAAFRLKREREVLLEDWPDFWEGIHYISRSDRPGSRAQQQSIPEREAGERQVIRISNAAPDDPKDGWCGLYKIYLTDQSFGNTLFEMNYPR